MRTIKEILNKILWDENIKKENYELFYLDRKENKLIKIKTEDILKVEDNLLVTKNRLIPLHRIKKVYEKGELIWFRK